MIQIHTTYNSNEDILVFLPNYKDIERCIENFTNMYDKLIESNDNQLTIIDFVIIKIYSETNKDEIAQIYFPTEINTRKIIISTNIIETCYLIDSIVHVIDSGYTCNLEINLKTGIPISNIVPISQLSAIQRLNCLSKIKDGICHRMYSEKMFKQLDIYKKPCILYTPLIDIIIYIKCNINTTISNIFKYPFITAPNEIVVLQAFHELYVIGILTRYGTIYNSLRDLFFMRSFNPLLLLMLVYSIKLYCFNDMIIIVSWLLNINSLKIPYENTLEIGECIDLYTIWLTRFKSSRSDGINYKDNKKYYRLSSNIPSIGIFNDDLE